MVLPLYVFSIAISRLERQDRSKEEKSGQAWHSMGSAKAKKLIPGSPLLCSTIGSSLLGLNLLRGSRVDLHIQGHWL